MRKIIAIVIPLLPILSIYKSPIPKVDFGTFTICVITILMILYLKNNNKKIVLCTRKQPLNMLLVYSTYIFINFLLSLLFYQLNVSVFTVLARVIKFCVIILFINLCISNELFDYKLLYKELKVVTVLSCLMILLQTMSYYVLKKNIYGVFMQLVLQGDYKYIDYNSMNLQYLYRPCAFFLEPSGLSSYLVLYLAILLSSKPEKKSIVLAIFVTICMILSTSGQAFLYCGILWILFICKCFRKYLNKTTILLLLIIILILPIILYRLYSLEIIYKSIQRIVDGSSSGGNAVNARVLSFYYYNTLSFVNKLFGVGYGNPIPNVYFNSMGYTLYCTGFCGLLIVIDFFIRILKKYKNKSFIICWIISTVFSTTFIATNIAFYYPYIIGENEQMKNKNTI